MRGLMLCVVGVVLAGCTTPSLGPLYSQDVVVRDEAYLGTWVDQQREGRYVVGKGDGRAYAVRYERIGGDTSIGLVELEAVVVELDGTRYADVYPAKGARDEVGKRYGTLFLPVHNIVRLSMDGDELSVEMLDIDWTKKHATEAATARPDGAPVLTGDPASLQALVREAEADARGFSDDALVLRRDMEP